MKDCIFCKIAGKEIPAEIVYEDEDALAFRDLNPQAPVHILIIPKKHLPRISEVSREDERLLGHLQFIAGKISETLNTGDFRIVSNNGRKAGQTVDHLHYHFLAGRRMNWPPG